MNTLKRWGILPLIILAALLAIGWGAEIHKVVNQNVVLHLPAELAGFTDRVQLLIDSSSVPDWRKYGSNGYMADPNEPLHFIDIDYYPEFTTHSVTTNLDSLILKYGQNVVAAQGIVPWVAVWTTDSLAAQMQRGTWTKVWSTAAFLGHYVADIHCPMHATKNYNGQLTGQTGIHNRYETEMFTPAVLASITVMPTTVSNLSNPIAYLFDRVYESNSYVDSILAADLYAHALDATYGDTYKATLWNKTKLFTQLQIQRATQTYANLIYTAWIKAGSPKVPRLSNPVFNIVSTPARYDSIGVELTKSDSVIITNTGVVQLQITSVTSGNNAFIVSPTTASLASGTAKTFFVSYTPNKAGKDSAYIHFLHNGLTNDSVKVIGSGLGVMNLKNARALANGSKIVFDGVVTRAKGSYTYIQDDSAGMVMYQQTGIWRDSVASNKIRGGMKIRIMGRTSEYMQQKEIINTNLISYKILSYSYPPPTPKTITLKQITLSGEQYEACLVRIAGLSVTAGLATNYAAQTSYPIKDNTDSSTVVVLRIPDATDSNVDGTKVSTPITFTGVVGQFHSTNPSAGYQLMAIDTTDIVAYEGSSIPVLTILKTTVAYGNVAKSTTKRDTIKVVNSSINTLIVDSIYTKTSPFMVDRINGTVGTDTFKIVVSFTPIAIGSYTDTLYLHNNSAMPLIKIPLSGNSPAPVFGVSKTSIVYSNGAKGITKKDTIIIINNSINTLTIDSIYTKATAFTVDKSGGIMVMDTLKIVVLFTPTAIASYSDTLYLQNNSVTPLVKISLSGNCTTRIEDAASGIPALYSLAQNFPNPFNPTTTLRYGLPSRSSVRLIIYNVLGQVVKELINTEQQAGIQSVVWNANASSGLYFYRLEATSKDNPSKRFVETKKMLLLK